MPDKPRIAVTGGTGKLGRAVVDDLRAHGYTVLNIDRVRPTEEGFAYRSLVADLSDFGQTVDALRDCAAVVHLAAIPHNNYYTDAVTFANNLTSVYNVFHAAKTLGIKRVVQASSETTLGLPLHKNPPAFAPITEDDPVTARSSYAEAKILGEELGRWFYQTAGITSAALRLSNVMTPASYARFEAWQDKPEYRAMNFWSYIDARDGAQACRLALEADFEGAESFIIANDDTVMRTPTAELIQQVVPQVKLRELRHERVTLLSIDKARRMLGYNPQYAWQDQVAQATAVATH